jgi:hypothetical protein
MLSGVKRVSCKVEVEDQRRSVPSAQMPPEKWGCMTLGSRSLHSSLVTEGYRVVALVSSNRADGVQACAECELEYGQTHLGREFHQLESPAVELPPHELCFEARLTHQSFFANLGSQPVFQLDPPRTDLDTQRVLGQAEHRGVDRDSRRGWKLDVADERVEFLGQERVGRVRRPEGSCTVRRIDAHVYARESDVVLVQVANDKLDRADDFIDLRWGRLEPVRVLVLSVVKLSQLFTRRRLKPNGEVGIGGLSAMSLCIV